MKKVISLFKRDYERTRLVFNEIVPGAGWVLSGEGVATEKIDGTSCLWRGGRLYKRYDAKKGKQPPLGFEPAQDPDPITGHWPGWVPVGDGPEDKWHREGLANSSLLEDGKTYELVGPKVQGNPYTLAKHTLRLHGDIPIRDFPRTFSGILAYFKEHPDLEGVVWHHPNGEMVKIKRRDFGLPWPQDQPVQKEIVE